MPTFSLSWTVKDTEQIVSVRTLAERVINNFSAIRRAAVNGGLAQDPSIRFVTDDTPGAQWGMTIIDGDHTNAYVSVVNTLGPTIHISIKEQDGLVAQYTIMPNLHNPQKDNWRFVLTDVPDEHVPSESPRIEQQLGEVTFWLTQLVWLLPEEGG